MRTILIFTAIALAAAPASAAVFAVDGGFGATSATRSTSAGLDFLDLPITTGNYSDIDAELAPGGLFDGWRRAFGFEVALLFFDGGVPSITGSEPPAEYTDPADVAATSALMELVGLTEASGSIDLSEGFLAGGSPDPDEAPAAYLLRRFDPDLGEFTSAAAVTGVFRTRELPFGGDNIGHWLVREYEVPAPAGLALFGLGALGLALRRR